MASALSPATWPFDLKLLPDSAYLVGGSVRDALLHRQADYLDLDFVLPKGAVNLASTIAKHYRVGFVVLDAENQIARAVFDNATIDFAEQVGPTLETDLHRRDFTINAIAYHPQTDTLIDPLNGIDDLKQQTLRMVSPDNLAEDPLRLLRAYRQAAQLSFTIDTQTRSTIRELAPLLAKIPAERVRHELDALLSKANGNQCLKMAWEDGLLNSWLPDITETHLSQLQHLDQALAQFQQTLPEFAAQIQHWKESVPPGFYRSWVKIAKLAQLMPTDLNQAEARLRYLKYSRSESQAVLKVLQAQPYLDGLQQHDLSRKAQYYLFKLSDVHFPAVALRALAQTIPQPRIFELVKRFDSPQDPVAHPQPLLSGKDLMTHLNLRPGPQIGELLKAIELAQAEGLIASPAEALIWVSQL
jgi:tRNA nucleotidyltransferase (CCA-adding enzyme)